MSNSPGYGEEYAVHPAFDFQISDNRPAESAPAWDGYWDPCNTYTETSGQPSLEDEEGIDSETTSCYISKEFNKSTLFVYKYFFLYIIFNNKECSFFDLHSF